ncbi:MAG: hypothetical protein ABR508_02020 [Candidatus Baltobacteraceae bacterium]
MLAQPRLAPPQRVRTAKRATQRGISRKERARYQSLVQFSACLVVALALFMTYLALNARLTSLNYGYVKAQHQRTALQAQTARLDEQLAVLRGDDRLSMLAARLQMQDPQQFALITMPGPVRAQTGTHLAFLAGLATLFGAK